MALILKVQFCSYELGELKYRNELCVEYLGSRRAARRSLYRCICCESIGDPQGSRLNCFGVCEPVGWGVFGVCCAARVAWIADNKKKEELPI